MTGLIGWWPLHEDSGNTAHDLSGNNNHGTLNGGITQGVAGKGGLTSYSFDGSDDYVEASTSVSGNLVEYSLSFWICVDSTSDGEYNSIYDFNLDGARIQGGFADGTRANAGDLLFRNQPSGFNPRVSASLDDNQWHHIVVRWSKSDSYLELYVNGSRTDRYTGEKVSASIDRNDNDTVSLGGNGTDALDGKISDFRFYDRALSTQEIQELYDWGSGDYARPLNDQNSSSAVARWPLDGDADDVWASNNGAVNGSISWSNDSIRGQAASFDGSSYIDFGDVEDLGSNLGQAFTLSSWVRPDSADLDGSTNDVLSKGGANEWDNYQVGIDSNQFFARVGTEGSYYPKVSSQSQPTAENWYHVVCVYDGDEVLLYVNGVMKDRNSDISGSPNNISSAAKIGAFDPEGTQDNKYWSGSVDDVRIYDRALRPEEVFELYRWGTGGRDLRKFTVNSR